MQENKQDLCKKILTLEWEIDDLRDQNAVLKRKLREKVITHKYRGSQQFLISKSVEPNEELKVEQLFPQVLSTTDTTLRTLDVYFT